MAKHPTLTWQDGRWHCEGRGIHAGDILELKCGKEWMFVRIESSGQGRLLSAWTQIKGRDFVSSIDTDFDVLRWPT